MPTNNTYYVANAGSDSNSGLSALLPWQTITHAFSVASTGDTVLANGGDTFRETGTFSANGQSIGAYGTGLPIISGCDVASSFTQEVLSYENFTDASGPKPEGWWELSETSGSRADGNTTNNNTLTETNGPVTRVAGPTPSVPYAATFVGASSQALTRSDASLSAGFPGKIGVADGDLTAGCWVYQSTYSDAMALSKLGYNVGSEYSGQATINIIDDAYGQHAASDAGGVPLNTWTHLVITWKQSTGVGTLYVNGAAYGTTVTSATMVQDSTAFNVGTCTDFAAWYGNIAEPFVFASLLTPTQVASIYAAGLAGASATVYYATLAADPKQVFEDGVALAAAASKVTMQVGSFWFDSADSRIYVRTFEDASPSGHVIEVGARDSSLIVSAVTGVTIGTVLAQGSRKWGVNATGDYTGLQVNGLISEKSWGAGWMFSQDMATNTTITGVVVQNAEFRLNSGCGMDGSIKNFTGWQFLNNYHHDNCLLAGTVIDQQHYSAGMKILSTVRTGGAGTVISGCRFINNGSAAGLWQSQGCGLWCDTVSGVAVSSCTMTGNYGSGLNVEINSGCTFKFVASYANHSAANFYFIADASTNLDTCVLANSVGYGSVYGLYVTGNGYSTGGSCVNNTFQNVICTGASTANLYAVFGANNDGVNGSGNVYTYNCFGPQATNFIQWGSSTYSTYALWNSASGAGAGITDHYVNADPQFTNAATGNFSLQATSPCIDAGVFINGINNNFSGRAPDMGAFEFNQNSPNVMSPAANPNCVITPTGQNLFTATLAV